MEESQAIPISECEENTLYKINARNAQLGIYTETNIETPGFIILRSKFNQRYLDVEYHWDAGQPFGTASPLGKIEEIPFNLTRGAAVQGREKSDECIKEALATFRYLESATERQFPGYQERRALRRARNLLSHWRRRDEYDSDSLKEASRALSEKIRISTEKNLDL